MPIKGRTKDSFSCIPVALCTQFQFTVFTVLQQDGGLLEARTHILLTSTSPVVPGIKQAAISASGCYAFDCVPIPQIS